MIPNITAFFLVLEVLQGIYLWVFYQFSRYFENGVSNSKFFLQEEIVNGRISLAKKFTIGNGVFEITTKLVKDSNVNPLKNFQDQEESSNSVIGIQVLPDTHKNWN